MRKRLILVALVQVVLVVGLGMAMARHAMPLGVRGEWEWLRLPPAVSATWPDLAIGTAAVVLFAALAALGSKVLAGRPSMAREALAVVTLFVLSVLVQLVVLSSAPPGYGLTKWAIALHNPGSSGYFTVARRQIHDPRRFLADYPEWIRHQDALHVGTHPPGLFLLAHGLRRFFEARPQAARTVVRGLPASVEAGFRAIGEYDRLSLADRASLGAAGLLTLIACAATVVPLYVLARARLSAAVAWAAAALWPLVPSVILFQPAADTAFPVLATSALALAAHAQGRSLRSGMALALAAGLILALGMVATLAFLPIGLIVAILMATEPGRPLTQRILLIGATGAGFLIPTLAWWALTGANPFVIWWWNQRNHARFYVEFPKTYRAWVLANPVELIVALGLPAAVWAVLGLFDRQNGPRVSWATVGVVILLTLSGRNLSEVARLWLPMMPPLLIASSAGLSRFQGGGRDLGIAVALMGLETLVLQSMIQVVYPV